MQPQERLSSCGFLPRAREMLQLEQLFQLCHLCTLREPHVSAGQCRVTTTATACALADKSLSEE